MKFAVAFVLTFGGGDQPPRDPWFGADKVKHFFAGAFVQSVSYSTLRAAGAPHGESLLGASLTSVAVATGKEVVDSRRGGVFSGRDLAWSAGGAGAATLLLDRTRR